MQDTTLSISFAQRGKRQYKYRFMVVILRPLLLFFGAIGSLCSILQVEQMPVGITSPLESFKVLLNLLFTISEEHQAYMYTHFTVSISSESYYNYITVAIAVIALLLVSYIILSHVTQSKTMVFLLLILSVGVQIYLGVFASPFWNILLWGAVFLYILPRLATFLAIAGVIIVIAFTYTGPSPNLYIISNNIRDMLGQQKEQPQTADITLQEIVPRYIPMRQETAGLSPTIEGGDAFGIYWLERFSGSQIGTAVGQRIWLLWLIGLGFCMSFFIWILLKLINAKKSRSFFKSTNCNVAVSYMFSYMVAWLKLFNMIEPNVAYLAQDSQELPPNYYAAVEIWQEATYSGHMISEDKKMQMYIFLQEVITMLRKKSNRFLWLKLYLQMLMWDF